LQKIKVWDLMVGLLSSLFYFFDLLEMVEDKMYTVRVGSQRTLHADGRGKDVHGKGWISMNLTCKY
jgi:hypothetical protein